MIHAKRTGEWWYITVPEKWDGYTIESLFRTVWQAPKKLTHALRMEKAVKLNDANANWTSSLAKGDILAIRLFAESSFSAQPTYNDMNILYEDDHLPVES